MVAPRFRRTSRPMRITDSFNLWKLMEQGMADGVLAAAGRDTVVEGATSDEFPTPARRPAYSVLASEFDDTPALPPWEAGVEACMRGFTA